MSDTITAPTEQEAPAFAVGDVLVVIEGEHEREVVEVYGVHVETDGTYTLAVGSFEGGVEEPFEVKDEDVEKIDGQAAGCGAQLFAGSHWDPPEWCGDPAAFREEDSSDSYSCSKHRGWDSDPGYDGP